MKHIVFGASGFIGRHLVQELVRAQRDVTAVIRREGDARFFPSQVKVALIQDFSQESLAKILGDYDLVYNCTANVHPHQSLTQYRKVQVELCESIARACTQAGCRKMIQLSSVEVYGEFASHAMKEDYACRPLFDFQQSLLDREKVLQKVVAETGLPVVVLRPAATFGAGSPFTDMLVEAHAKGKFPVIGSGTPISSGVDTRDIGRAMLFLAEHPHTSGETFNLQAYEYSMERLKATLDELTEQNSRFMRLPLVLAKVLARILVSVTPFGKLPFITPFIVHAATQSLRIDDSKLRALGFKPKYELTDSVGAMLSGGVEESTLGGESHYA